MLGGVVEPLPLATADSDPPNARAMMLVIARTTTRIFGSFSALLLTRRELNAVSNTCTSHHRQHIHDCATLFERWRMSISGDAEQATE